MDEEIKLTGYQKELMKYSISGSLNHELSNIGLLIDVSVSVFSMCDEDFESSELAKKLNSFSDSALELTAILSSMRYRIMNKEANNE
jgi:hypothetical protein